MAENDEIETRDALDDAATMRPAAVGPSVPADGTALARVDQFVLEEELGRGGFGAVYRARDSVSGVYVAVKTLPPEMRDDAEALESARANFQLLSRLHHPNVASALVLHPVCDVAYFSDDVRRDLHVASGDVLLVMEYAPGMTLSRWRRSFPDRRVPNDLALAVLRQIADALDFAHERKIVHRDVKPANVMVETKADGSLAVRVLDFGIAAELHTMQSQARVVPDAVFALNTVGTRPYMAPEQWMGLRPDAATDQYALAALYCELVADEVPWQSVHENGDLALAYECIVKHEPAVPEGVPKGCRRAVKRALAKRPQDRHASCRAFCAALEKGATGGGMKIGWIAAGVAAVLVSVSGAVAVQRAGERERSRAEAAARTMRVASEKARKDAEAAKEAKRAADEKSRQEAAERARRTVEEKERAEAVQAKAKADEKAREDAEEAARAKRAVAEKERAEAVARAKRLAEENARKEAEEAARAKRAAAEKERAEAMARAKRLADEKARKEAEVAKERARRCAEENARAELVATLRKGSQYLPDPSGLAAGTQRQVKLSDDFVMTFVWCPPGRFLMGSPADEPMRNNGEVQHVVTLTKGFWMGQTEVTRRQWKRLMGGARFSWTALWGGDGDYPVDEVTWQQCVVFCERMSAMAHAKFRLPTEAEWEYACRAGTATPFSFGSALNGDAACCAGVAEPYGTSEPGSNSYGKSARVKSYARNPWGLYDMHGNLFEWCADWYGDYATADATDPTGPATGNARVVRGGCWNFAPKMCRSAFRSRQPPLAQDDQTGFRVCCDALPSNP